MSEKASKESQYSFMPPSFALVGVRGVTKGLIRSSTLPWGAPVLFAKKKVNTLQLCIDYR